MITITIFVTLAICIDTSLTFRLFKTDIYKGKKFEHLATLKEVDELNDLKKYLNSLTSIQGVFIGSNDLKTFHHNNKTFTRDDLKKISTGMLVRENNI